MNPKSSFWLYGIDHGIRLILWANQCCPISKEENIKNIHNVMQCTRNQEKVILVINQHPVETSDQANIVKQCIRELKERAPLLPIKADFGEILSSCDRMITKASTAILPQEFAAGKKSYLVLRICGASMRRECGF